MYIAACEICGRILTFVPDEPDGNNGYPEGSGHMECSKCGVQNTWRIIERKDQRIK